MMKSTNDQPSVPPSKSEPVASSPKGDRVIIVQATASEYKDNSIDRNGRYTRGRLRPPPQDNEAKAACIYCPPETLTALQNIISNTKVLGATYNNPYVGDTSQEPQSNKFPDDSAKWTARDFQILARLELANTDGKIKTGLYGNLLSLSQIAAIRALTKNMVVASGVKQYQQYGGYRSTVQDLSQDKTEKRDVMVIDQSAVQFQDPYNTGGLFFHPTGKSMFASPQATEDHKRWQEATYEATFGRSRPIPPSGEFSQNNIDPKEWQQATWSWLVAKENNQAVEIKSVSGLVDVKSLREYFAADLEIMMKSTSAQVNTIGEERKIDLVVAAAGMGFFAAGVKAGNSTQPPLWLRKARLEGYISFLTKLKEQPDSKDIRGQVASMSFPFSQDNECKEEMIRLRKAVTDLGLEYGNDGKIDLLHPDIGKKDRLRVISNCGDPHAFAGNEGIINQSVDAMIACNLTTGVSDLNAFRNTQIKTKEININISYSQSKAVAAKKTQEPKQTEDRAKPKKESKWYTPFLTLLKMLWPFKPKSQPNLGEGAHGKVETSKARDALEKSDGIIENKGQKIDTKSPPSQENTIAKDPPPKGQAPAALGKMEEEKKTIVPEETVPKNQEPQRKTVTLKSTAGKDPPLQEQVTNGLTAADRAAVENVRRPTSITNVGETIDSTKILGVPRGGMNVVSKGIDQVVIQ